MKTHYRTHTCGSLRVESAGNEVRLSGWVHRTRDHGDLVFVDLRDHYGTTQCVVEPQTEAFASVAALSPESVISIKGRVQARTDDTINAELETGEIEVHITELTVLSAAEELPLPVFGEPDYPEDLRLRNRFLDLRRASVKRNVLLRSEVIRFLRQQMHDAGFIDFQTPLLTVSSPEGARDFLVPSRMHQGKFYALPQAPQLYKQMIMVSGFDRYFQIAPCFRDEDARADRSPGEFYQLDIEMAFVSQQDVFEAVEPIMQELFEQFSPNKKVVHPFEQITYADSMRRFATDKPDLRNPLEYQDVSEHFREGGFGLFAKMLRSSDNRIWAVKATGGGRRAFCDRMNSWAQSQGQAGLGYVFWREEDGETVGAGPIAKNLGQDQTKALQDQLGACAGDAAFFIAGDPSQFQPFAALARDYIGAELELINTDEFRFCWIVDFPMFERDAETHQLKFTHNPFSMPKGGAQAVEDLDPLEIIAQQYDIVCNGIELSSGAIRNHDPKLLIKLFNLCGYSEKEIQEAFGDFFRALHFGAPPHGGIAPGLDRIVMLLADTPNIREVTLFPMNQRGQELLMGSPSEVDDSQLEVLGLRRMIKPSNS